MNCEYMFLTITTKCTSRVIYEFLFVFVAVNLSNAPRLETSQY